MDKRNTEKLENVRTRFSKWQMKQIDYLTFNINLILTISLAIIGFIITSEYNNDIYDFCQSKCPKSLVTIILFLVIITIGAVLNYIRFYDIKFTKDIVKFRKEKLNSSEQSKTSIEKKIKKLQSVTNVLGKISLVMFSIMTILFIISIWTFI
jgi:hypothetical protein